MGIRLKILLAFILCSSLTGGVGLILLEHGMGESYDAIERRQIVTSMGQVEQSLEAAAASLMSQTKDWAVWNEMYRYVRKPDAAWARENIGEDALKEADLSMAMVIDRSGRIVNADARDGLTRTMLLANSYLREFRLTERKVRCGLTLLDPGIVLTCWAGIVRGDGSGKVAGTLVTGRLLDAERLETLREQTQMPFELLPYANPPPGLTPWFGVIPAGLIGHSDFWTSLEPQFYHLYYPLHDVRGKNIAQLHLDLPRSLHEEGAKAYRALRLQLVLIIVVMTALLGWALNLLVIRRLRRFAAELEDLAQNSTWDKDVDITGGDELGVVEANVNKLLAVIRTQITGLNELSRQDALTGVYNRRAFDERLAGERRDALRSKEPLSLLIIDVDHFKRYNDHYGHPAGDAALKAVAAVLTAAIRRPRDSAARIGGEEFAVLLPGTDLDGALRTAEQIRQLLAQRDIAHADSPVSGQLTLSLGIALFADEPARRFMRRADRALYAAKAAGRDRIVCDDPSSAEELPPDSDETDESSPQNG